MRVEDSKLVIYYRVSTNNIISSNKKDGKKNFKHSQTIMMQQHAVGKYLREVLKLSEEKIAKIQIFSDIGYSGKKNTVRPEFNKMMKLVRQKKFDNIICYQLDRLSRDTRTAVKLLIEMMENNVGVVCTEQPLLNLDSTNPFALPICTILAVLGELERESIGNRIKHGLDAAKARGVKLGKKKQYGPEVDEMILRWVYEKGVTKVKTAKCLGVGRTYVTEVCMKNRSRYESIPISIPVIND